MCMETPVGYPPRHTQFYKSLNIVKEVFLKFLVYFLNMSSEESWKVIERFSWY